MSTSDPTTQTTLNIPSLIAFAFLAFLFLRYFFFSSSNSSNASDPSGFPAFPGASSSARRRVTPEKIDTVATMFPQLARRDIEWDLLRNGGSVQATTEKVLREGRLGNPPPNFRASTPPTGTPAPSSSNRPNRNQGTPSKPEHPDLITRYNLSSKVTAASSSSSSANQEIQQEKTQWSSNKNERADMLKRRREEMVLAARRKMEEKQQSG